MAIEGKVARILDEYSVIINRGSADGVADGMRFVVFTEVDEVADPDTGDSLGKWELIKGRLSAAHVQERMTVCSAEAKAEEVAQGDPSTHTLSAEMIKVSMPAKAGGPAGEKLNVKKSDLSGVPATKPIAVGDRVRSVGE